MTIDPRWSIFLSLFLAILGFLSGAGAEFTDLGMGSTQVKALLALVALIMGIGNAINAVLGAIPSASGHTEGFYLGPKEAPKEPPKP